MTTTHTPRTENSALSPDATSYSAAAVADSTRWRVLMQGGAAALAIIVAAIHVIDQSGFPGNKTPSYVGIGYWLLEVSAIVIAVALLRSGHRLLRPAVLGIGAGPLAGFIFSRGPGLPGYTDDRGNWGEPLGIVSIVVEALLIVIALAGTAITVRTERASR